MLKKTIFTTVIFAAILIIYVFSSVVAEAQTNGPSDEIYKNSVLEEGDAPADYVTLVKNVDNFLPLKIGYDSRVLMLVQNQNGQDYSEQFTSAWNHAKDVGLFPSNASFKAVIFDENDWDNTDKLKAIDNADFIFMNSFATDKEDMIYKTWRTAAPKKYTDYAKHNGKKTVVFSMNILSDVQLYPNADGIFVTNNPDDTDKNRQDELNSNHTAKVDLRGAIEVAFGIYGAYGKLPVNIYEFDPVTKSYNDNVIYNKGFGIEYDPITSMDKVSVLLEFSRTEYTGHEICPKVIVTVENQHPINTNTKTLTEGKDYSIKYSDNVEVGTATVTVTGMGSYIGQKSEKFLIVESMGTTPGSSSTNGNAILLQSGDTPSVPKTGDDFNPAWWFTAAMLSGFAILILLKKPIDKK